jgi:hypothetical protein
VIEGLRALLGGCGFLRNLARASYRSATAGRGRLTRPTEPIEQVEGVWRPSGGGTAAPKCLYSVVEFWKMHAKVMVLHFIFAAEKAPLPEEGRHAREGSASDCERVALGVNGLNGLNGLKGRTH